MQILGRICSGFALLLLAGCASIPMETQRAWSSDIDLALSQPPAALRADADAGNRHAMIAYALVLHYGLHGQPVDAKTADAYVARAVRPVRYDTMFIWIAATKKMPGHLMPVSTPIYDYSPAQARVVDACAAIVAPQGDPADLAAKLEKGVCGGTDNYHRLKGLWHATN